jgi:O-antigen/teichoic acid export membrane protein
LNNNKIIKNATWIIACKIVQSILSFIIGTLTVRYLGPTNYGVITYAASVISFLLPIMQLGLKNTLVKEFIRNPNKEGEILGTALIINIISSLFSMAGAITFVSIANAGERETIIVCALYSLVLLFQATEMTVYWFQAKLLSKYPSIATLIAYVVVAIYKVYLLVTGKSVVWFALSYVLDFFLISIILLVIYKKLSDKKLSINWSIGRQMLSRSKYYIIPSLMVVFYQHTDRIMLKLMVSDLETGLFSAAITCTGMTGFVFHAIIDSARTVILETKERTPELYEKRVVQLYSIITALALAQSVFITVLAKPIVVLLYGKAYLASVPILQLAVWYDTFGYYSSVRNIWILAEEKQKHLTKINVAGALANIALNACLIPIWGGIGAAIASIISQFFTNVITGFIFKPIRRNNYLMLKGLNPKVIIGIALSMLSLKKKKNERE